MELSYSLLDIIDLVIITMGGTIIVSFGLFNYDYFNTKFFGPSIKCSHCKKTFSIKDKEFICKENLCPFWDMIIWRSKV